MKANREQLKGIIKELLIEILSEGLGNVQAAAYRPPAPGRAPIGAVSSRPVQRRHEFDPRIDTPLNGGRSPTSALKEAIRANSGGSKVLADILADTAMTTLPAQMAHGDVGTPPPGSGASSHALPQQEQFHGAPEEVFGESASRWADLAFNEVKKKTA